jgi:hypothetical protein
MFFVLKSVWLEMLGSYLFFYSEKKIEAINTLGQEVLKIIYYATHCVAVIHMRVKTTSDYSPMQH